MRGLSSFNVERARRIARVSAKAAAGLAGACVAAALILWDADFYAARDRWEHFRLALLGDWRPRDGCPPGTRDRRCADVNALLKALEEMDDVTFFRAAPVAGSDLEVLTGARFATPRAVVTGPASKRWCYIAFGEGVVTRRLDLASRIGDEPPEYFDAAAIDAGELAALGLGTARLADLARSHCHLGPDIPEDADEEGA